MARLWQGGFELNSNTNGVEWSTTSGSPSIQTGTVRTGTYAGRITSLSSLTAKGWNFQYASSAGGGPYYFRVYLRLATYPSAENTIIVLSSSGGFVGAGVEGWITVDSSGALRLKTASDGTIGSASSALSTGTWYRIEIQTNQTPAGGSRVLRALIDGVEFAGSSSLTYATGVNRFMLGGNLQAENQTTGDWYFDDIAINDSTGSFQTGYPSSGGIFHCVPNGTGDANAWTRGGTNSGNNWDQVNEVTPTDGTDYNQSSTLNQEDLFAMTDSGLTSTDVINVVCVGGRFVGAGASNSSTFKFEIEKTASGTKSQSAGLKPSTTFVTNQISAPWTYPLVTYQDPDGASWTNTTIDSMQAGYIISTSNSNVDRLNTLWVSVDYAPASFNPYPDKWMPDVEIPIFEQTKVVSY